MKFRIISALVKKDLKLFVREPATLFLLILFPLMVSFTFGLAFGGMDSGGDTQFQIGLVNMDANSTDVNWSDSFVGNLTAVNGTVISFYDNNETGQADLLSGGLQALVIIPEGFGNSIDSYYLSPFNGSSWTNTTVQLFVDSGSMIASSAIPPMIQQVLISTIYGERAGSLELPISIGSPSLVSVSELNMWDFMAPGIFAFAAIFMIMTVAQSMTVERDGGLLKRIATTPVTASEVIFSRALSYMVVGIAQVALVFAGSYAIGYRPATDAAGFAFAFLIVVTFTMTTVGMGLITAVVSKSADVATGIGFIFIMPQLFFGTFMPLGGLSDTIGTYMPSNYVTHALTTLFLRGAPVTTPSIWIDLIIVGMVGVSLLALGALLFGRQISRH